MPVYTGHCLFSSKESFILDMSIVYIKNFLINFKWVLRGMIDVFPVSRIESLVILYWGFNCITK